MFNFIIVYKLDPPQFQKEIYIQKKRGTACHILDEGRRKIP